MVVAAFVTHFPIPPIYPYLPFTPGYHSRLVMSTVSQGIIVLLGPPTSPTGLEYTAITNTSATLYWLPPVIADCVVNYKYRDCQNYR